MIRRSGRKEQVESHIIDIQRKGKDMKDNGREYYEVPSKKGPFHMGTVSDVIAGGTEGAVQQVQLSQPDNDPLELVLDASVQQNGYLRKGRKTKPKRQNRTRNGKAWKRQSQDQAQVSKSQPKSTPTNPEVNK
ncbi:hypothetical protein Tco_0331960 [Tanacetum coccineum]